MRTGRGAQMFNLKEKVMGVIIIESYSCFGFNSAVLE